MEQCLICTIPDALAQTLKVLSCDGSLLERLPESFPQLQVLHVARCTRLTALPKSLPSLPIHLSDSGSGIRQRPLSAEDSFSGLHTSQPVNPCKTL